MTHYLLKLPFGHTIPVEDDPGWLCPFVGLDKLCQQLLGNLFEVLYAHISFGSKTSI